MHRFLLGSDDTFLTVAPRWADVGPVAQVALIAFLLMLPVALIVWLYRYECRLITGLQACGLLILRLLIVLALWFAVSFQPQVTEVHDSPGRLRVAVDLSASMDVSDHD